MYARDLALIATPIGAIRIEGRDEHIDSIRILDFDEPPCRAGAATVAEAVHQIEQWLAGERTGFDLPLAPAATPRGAELRQALIDVGYGDTLSYGAFARLHHSAPRAVGQLCARNPFPIVVPCHRILASGGRLGHYSAGKGPETKAWLIEHERAHRSTQETLL